MPGRSWGAGRARGVSVVVAIVTCVPLAVGGSHAQEPQHVLPVATELVRLDVVVTDKGGRPRAGLTRDDFVVLEDGAAQPIVRFEAYRAAAPAGEAVVSEGTVAGPRPAPAAAPAAPARYVVLAVDDVHIEVHNLFRVKKTLAQFLDRDLGAEDHVAVVTTSGSLNEAFTADKAALQKSVAGLTVRDRKVRWVGAPYMTEYQAERILLGDPEALRVAIDEIVADRMSPNPGQEAMAFARQMTAESFHNARITLETTEAIVRGLAPLRGRKIVVLVTDGFLTAIQLQGTSAFDIRRIADAGTRAGVIIYSLDSRGLVALSPGMSASSRMPVTASGYGVRQQLQRASELAVKDAMGALASDTGGFLWENSNDLGAGLRRILRDTETYYLIAYEPPNARRDGAFRKIEVRLPGQRDVRIRSRRGYFALDERKGRGAPAAASSGAAPGLPRPDASAVELDAALAASEPLAGLPVQLAADFVSADGRATQVVVSGHVALEPVSFAQVGGRRRASLSVSGAVHDAAGAVVERLEPERVALDVPAGEHAQTVRSGLDYQKAAPLKPGRYQVRLAVRDDGSGSVGSASEWVDVPELGAGTLTLSSLFVLRKNASSAGAEGDGLSLRSAQANRGFSRGEALYLQHFAYNAKRDTSGGAELVTQAEVWRAGVRLAATAPEPMAQAEAGGPPVPHTKSIKLDRFEPGTYEVRVVVTDRRSGATAARSVGITVE